jgi:Family of unknown function (DUF6510)
MDRLDGNAAAGVLGMLFAVEMTTVEAACAGCGQIAAIGALMVYKHGMGTIVRCPVCDAALIRVAEGGGRCWLDLRGVSVLQISVE